MVLVLMGSTQQIFIDLVVVTDYFHETHTHTQLECKLEFAEAVRRTKLQTVQKGEVKEEHRALVTETFWSTGARKGLSPIPWGAGGGAQSPEAQ